MKSNNFLDKFFPDKYWALVIPAYGAALVYCFSFIFVGIVFVFSYKEEKVIISNDKKTQ